MVWLIMFDEFLFKELLGLMLIAGVGLFDMI